MLDPSPYHEEHFMLVSTGKKKYKSVRRVFGSREDVVFVMKCTLNFLAKVHGCAFHGKGA